MPDDNVDLTMIARRLRQVLSEIGSLRDDINVLAAIAMRHDDTLTGLLHEVRATYSQHGRLANRVRDMEARQDA